MPTFQVALQEEIERVIEMLNTASEASDGRAVSLVKTKLQEAQLWAGKI